MSARRYQYGAPALCARAFIAKGHSYAKGDLFDYKGLKLDESNVSGMWSAEMIDFVDSPPAALAAPASVPSKQQQQRR